jgi:hypothetical protein
LRDFGSGGATADRDSGSSYEAGAAETDRDSIRRISCNEGRGADMKVNIEIDCTPAEARQFFGLPDVGPMQTAMMDRLQQQMMSNIDKMSPEALMQSWFMFDPKLAERFQDLFVSMTGLGSRSSDKKSA